MRSLFSLILLFSLLVLPQRNSQAKPIWPAHLDTAVSYVGTLEQGHNAGPVVTKFLTSVNLPAGNPWCAAFGSYSLTAAHTVEPAVRSGLATNYIRPWSIPAKLVLRGVKKIRPGTIGIYRRGYTEFGHFVFVINWNGASGTTVEGNTFPTSQDRGPQGVWIRKRSILPGNYFRIVAFTPVYYIHKAHYHLYFHFKNGIDHFG